MIAVDTGELMKVILYVQDMNAQVAFYRDSLGLVVKEPDGVKDFRDFYWVEFSTGACSLILHTGGKGHVEEDAPRIVFRVSNIHTSRMTLLERAVQIGEIRSPESGILVCEGKDPEGNTFSLEGRDEKALTSLIMTVSPGTTPTYVSVNSRRGRSITLLRKNKMLMFAEVLLMSVLLCAETLLVPSQLIPALLLAMALLWLQGCTWSKLGLSNPQRWRLVIFLGCVFGILYALLQTLAIGPIVTAIVHATSHQNLPSYNIPGAFLILPMIRIWTSAAFVEEMLFRGYLLNRLADLFGRDFPGWSIAICLQAIIFGISHLSQGSVAAIESGIYGICAGLIYLASSRNLWLCAITRGAMETLSFLLKFAGL